MNLKEFVMGARPKTLVAAIVPPVAAHSLYFYESSKTEYTYLILCLLLALCIQIATNFYNDAVDFKKGADENRVGPKRITTQDSYKQVLIIGHIFILMAFLIGIPLVIKGGLIYLIFGFISLYLAYGYTGGPYPLAYLGLGEIFVFLFFGLLATGGSYYLFAGEFSINVFLLGTQIGFLSCILIAVNNFRDRKTDVLVGKKTLATKLTSYKYLKLIDLFIFLPYVILFYLVAFEKQSFIFALLAISLGHKTRDILREQSEKQNFDRALKLSGIHLLIFGALFSLGCFW